MQALHGTCPRCLVQLHSQTLPETLRALVTLLPYLTRPWAPEVATHPPVLPPIPTHPPTTQATLPRSRDGPPRVTEILLPAVEGLLPTQHPQVGTTARGESSFPAKLGVSLSGQGGSLGLPSGGHTLIVEASHHTLLRVTATSRNFRNARP